MLQHQFSHQLPTPQNCKIFSFQVRVCSCFAAADLLSSQVSHIFAQVSPKEYLVT